MLRERLPEYMRPAAYVVLEQLPLTPNGKLDRRALPAPQYGRDAAADAFVAPRDALEEVIAEVWREVLQVERWACTTTSSSWAGTRCSRPRCVARLARLLQVELSLRGFFESPTVSALAAAAQQRLGGRAGPRGRRDRCRCRAAEDLPLSFAQQRLWFLDRLLPGAQHVQHADGLAAAGPARGRGAERSVAAVVARHESLRTRLVLREGAPVQVIDPAPAEVLQVTDLSVAGAGGARGRARTRSPRRTRASRSIWRRVRCFAPRCCAWRRTSTCCW